MSVPTEEQASLSESFQTAQVLTNAEVFQVLQSNVEKQEKIDPSWQADHTLTETIKHCEAFSSTTNVHALNSIREALAQYYLMDFELGLLANLEPQTAEEAKKLIPSLDQANDPENRFTDDDVQAMLDSIASFRTF